LAAFIEEKSMKKHPIIFTGSLVLLAALLAVSLFPGQPAAGQSNEYITVVVKAGDSLGLYAKIYGTSGLAMMAANPDLKDGNKIYPGQVITIPVIKTFTPSLTTPFYYTVQAGDNIYAIARQFHMDASSIAFANGIKDNIVILGKTYIIPAGPHFHIVQKFETLYDIAAIYSTSAEKLQTFNDIPNPAALYIGQFVYIPVTYDAQPLPFSAVPVPPTNTPTVTLPTAVPAAATATRTPTSVPGTATPVVVPTRTATPLPSATPNTQPVEGDYIHISVRLGENLVTYTYRYGVTGGALLAANSQLKDPSKIYPGDNLTIPVIASFTPSRTTPFFYVIQPGETLYTVGTKFEMLPDVISRANPGASLAAGTTLLIPAGPHVYTVKAGDEMRYIAPKYGTTVEFLLKGNDLPNPDRIYLGQLIFIPIQYGAAPLPFTP
jgi:LysM repeat protein